MALAAGDCKGDEYGQFFRAPLEIQEFEMFQDNEQ
jgi:hypothetical protein